MGNLAIQNQPLKRRNSVSRGLDKIKAHEKGD
jgi:hypothetical protein